jgi:hypothetical protein
MSESTCTITEGTRMLFARNLTQVKAKLVDERSKHGAISDSRLSLENRIKICDELIILLGQADSVVTLIKSDLMELNRLITS